MQGYFYSLEYFIYSFAKKLSCLAFYILAFMTCSGEVGLASWLVRSTPERAVRVRALAGDIVLCSWARHFTLTVPLTTQLYKWVPANLMLGVTLRRTDIPSRGE